MEVTVVVVVVGGAGGLVLPVLQGEVPHAWICQAGQWGCRQRADSALRDVEWR